MATDTIKLNVGGTVFETTRTTIMKLNSGYLNKLIDKSSGFQNPKDNVWFIDRDPECFRVILNIARYGEVTFWNDLTNPEILIKEADFYLLAPEVVSIIMRYFENHRSKDEKRTAILMSMLNVAQESKRELQLLKASSEDLVRGMASQAYWTS